MGDRAPVHITIGGKLPREHLDEFAMRAAVYDLRIDWDGEPFLVLRPLPRVGRSNSTAPN
jgi:hypothetical protein